MLATLRRWTRRREDLERRRAYIQGYSFPHLLRERIVEHVDVELDDAGVRLVLDGLRAWFTACLHAEGKTLGMPSKAVDAAWHEFILMTHHYKSFCDEAFGYYLHHSPESTMTEPMSTAMQRTVLVSDRDPGLRAFHGVPLLFAVDSKIGLPDATFWTEKDIDALRESGKGWAGGGSCGSGDGGGGGCGGGGCGGG
jgi:hypothetical protein